MDFHRKFAGAAKTAIVVFSHFVDNFITNAKQNRSKFSGNRLAAGIGQLADQPIRFDGIFKPRLHPALLQTALDRSRTDFLAGIIKQGKLAAGLIETTGHPFTL